MNNLTPRCVRFAPAPGAAAPPAATAAAAATLVVAAPPAGGNNAAPLDLFSQGMPSGGGAGAGAGGELDFLWEYRFEHAAVLTIEVLEKNDSPKSMHSRTRQTADNRSSVSPFYLTTHFLLNTECLTSASVENFFYPSHRPSSQLCLRLALTPVH